LLAVIGLALSAYLTYLHVRLHHDPTYVSVCAFGDKVNCETVAASSYSVFAGLPVSVWGALGYLLLGWVALARRGGGRQNRGSGMLALYGAVLALVSVGLAAISTFAIGAFCIVCTATYVVNLAVAAIAIARARRGGGIVNSVADDIRDALSRPAPVARTGAVLLLITAATQVFVPEYWEMATWRQGVYGEAGVTDDGYPWIGAPEPRLTIHEYLDYECPHCKLAHRKLRRVLLDHPDELRLVRHDFARMRCQPNDSEIRRSSCAMARAGFCALDMGVFWEWNDAVLAHPRPLFKSARDSYFAEMASTLGLNFERFDTCMFAQETIERAQAVYRDARKQGITETPGYVVEGEIRTWEGVQQLVDEHL
jgi:uncharacterized membrane protein/protein-disulfide isomerase